jgi:hypothetical protein
MKKQVFEWPDFHRMLDVALAIWISEKPEASIHRELIDFLEYSNQKQLAASPQPQDTKGDDE